MGAFKEDKFISIYGREAAVPLIPKFWGFLSELPSIIPFYLIYLSGEPDYFLENWMEKSVPIQMESVAMLHVIQERDEVTYFNLLNNLKFGFTLTVTYLVSACGILAISYLLNELNYRVRFEAKRKLWAPQRVLGAVKSLGVPRFSAVGVFVLFFQFFFLFSQLFLTNSIKTNKVVSFF